MKESHDIALHRIEDKAKKRSVRHGGQDHPLQPGDRVWLRKRVLGRNKIQDFWESVPYEVISQTEGNNMVYNVKVLDGLGLVKVVNRMDLLEDITKEDEDQVESDVDSSDSSSSEEEWEFVESDTPMPSIFTIKDTQADRPAPVPNPTPEHATAAAPRRSSRAYKGQHSNLNKMPRSAVTRSQYVDQPVTDDFISQVNTGFVDMAQVLGSTLIEMMKVQKD